MSSPLKTQCARMVMVGFPGLSLDPDLKQLMDEGVFGAILFRRNVGLPEETAELCAQLKAHAARPFVLGVDQEGGRVARLRGPPFTTLPPLRDLGMREDPQSARRMGRLLAYEVSAAGFDWDFAPVLDVDTNPNNPVIGDRAFSHRPSLVSSLGVAMAEGMEEAGVASCGKHFPGHGDTHQDSHLTLPRLPHAMDRLEQIELAPFRAYAQAGLSSVMTAHVIFEALDRKVPATMSQRVLQGLLREQLGFQGLVVSDDLEMKAIADNYPVEEAVALGAAAGVDLFLVCHNALVQHRAIEGLVKAVESGRVHRAQVEAANARLDAFAQRFAQAARGDVSRLGSLEHRLLAEGLWAAPSGSDPTEVMLAKKSPPLKQE